MMFICKVMQKNRSVYGQDGVSTDKTFRFLRIFFQWMELNSHQVVICYRQVSAYTVHNKDILCLQHLKRKHVSTDKTDFFLLAILPDISHTCDAVNTYTPSKMVGTY